MSLQAEVVDGRVNVYRWDVGTLAWIAWDGSVTGGAGGGLTDTELRASPVPVSMAAGGGLTNAELRATPVPVSGTIAAVTTITDPVTVSNPTSATGTQSTVPDSATSVTLLASNASRLGAAVANDSSAALYMRLQSGAASVTTYTVKLVSGAYYEVPYDYTGAITGIWATDPGDGAARVTELTA